MSHLRPGASSHSSPGQGHSAPRNANINPPKRARGIGTSTRTLACSDMPGMPHVVPHIFAGSGWSPPGRLGYAQPRTCLGPRRHFARSRHGEGTRRSSHPSCLCLPCSGWPPRCSGACPATGSGPCLAAAETCTCGRSGVRILVASLCKRHKQRREFRAGSVRRCWLEACTAACWQGGTERGCESGTYSQNSRISPSGGAQ